MSELQGIAIIGAIAITVALITAKPATLENKDAVAETFPKFHLIRGESDGEGTLEFSGSLNGRTGRLVLDHGVLYEPKEGSPERIPSLKIKFTPEYYLIDPGVDLGAWGGYFAPGRGSSLETFQAGFRVSPVRLGFGILSADAVISRDLLGAGFSCYPPERWTKDFHHVGIGAWYAYPMVGTSSGASPGWVFGLSFSTK